jgi:hypothetical protein
MRTTQLIGLFSVLVFATAARAADDAVHVDVAAIERDRVL